MHELNLSRSEGPNFENLAFLNNLGLTIKFNVSSEKAGKSQGILSFLEGGNLEFHSEMHTMDPLKLFGPFDYEVAPLKYFRLSFSINFAYVTKHLWAKAGVSVTALPYLSENYMSKAISDHLKSFVESFDPYTIM